MPMPDLSAGKTLTFRGTSLNTAAASVSNGQSVISGIKVTHLDVSAVEIRQFTEPLALLDGIDVGGAWLGARHIEMRGTVYGATHAAAADLITTLEALFLIESGEFAFYALVFTKMSTGGGTTTIYCRPNGLRYNYDWSKHAGDASLPLAIEWAVTLYAKDPTF
jgi:hypothetical protein